MNNNINDLNGKDKSCENILYQLVFEYFGETNQNELKRGLLNIDYYYNNLVERGFIKLHRNEGKKIVTATESGMIYIQKYMNTDFQDLAPKISEFIHFLNFISNLCEKNHLVLWLIQGIHIKSALTNLMKFQTDLIKLRDKINNLHRDILGSITDSDEKKCIMEIIATIPNTEKLEFKEIEFEEINQKGFEIDKEKVLEYLENHPNTVYGELYEAFPNCDKNKLRYIHKKWENDVIKN